MAKSKSIRGPAAVNQARLQQTISAWAGFEGAFTDGHKPTRKDLPNFLEMTPEEVNKHNFGNEDAAKIASAFRRILLSEDLPPLLIELSVLESQRNAAADRQPQFVSAITSYLDDSTEDPPFLKHWRTALQKMAKSDEVATDLVPFPPFYNYVFFIHPCTSDAKLPAPQPVPKDLERLQSRDAPAVSEAKAIDFKEAKERPDRAEIKVEDLVNIFIDMVRKSLEGAGQRDSRSLEIFSGSVLLMVPFYRLIEFANRDYKESFDFKADPGGCLFALVLPAPKEEGSEIDLAGRLRRAAARISWLLYQSALAEADVNAKEDRAAMQAQHRLLREIAHAVEGPFDRGVQEFDSAYQDLLDGKKTAEQVREEFRQAQAKLHLANLALQASKYLVRLDDIVSTPEQRERTRQDIFDGRTDLKRLVQEAVADSRDIPALKNVSINLAENTQSVARLLVKGKREAWWVVLQLLLKNAGEEAAKIRQGEVQVTIEVTDLNRRKGRITITNPLQRPIPQDRLTIIHAVLSKEISQVPFNKEKPGSQGLGLATIVRLLDALRIAYSFSPKLDELTPRAAIFTIGEFEYARN